MWAQPEHSEYQKMVLTAWQKSARIPKRFLDIPRLKKNCAGRHIPEFNQSVFYWGDSSVGKSTLGCFILYKMALQEVQDHPSKAFPGLFLPVTELFEELKDCYSNKSKDGISAEALLRKYSDVPYLVLDDIGTERQTEWVFEKFYILVDRRYRDMLPTIFISNTRIKSITESMGCRVSRRICDMVGENIIKIS